VGAAQLRDGGNDERCTCGFSEGAEEIGTHTRNVAHVVPHIICKC
jgi:hypothetical protein